jgi:hypothetical protein
LLLLEEVTGVEILPIPLQNIKWKNITSIPLINTMRVMQKNGVRRL